MSRETRDIDEFPYEQFVWVIYLSGIIMVLGVILYLKTGLFQSKSSFKKEEETDLNGNVDKIISSIELIPQPPQGKSDQNQVIISYSNSETNTVITTNEHFYFLYLLSVQRLSAGHERWVPLKREIDMKHIKKMERSLGSKLLTYSWRINESQKSTVVSKINKNIASIIIRTDEESQEYGPESYYSLISNLSDDKSIILHKMK